MDDAVVRAILAGVGALVLLWLGLIAALLVTRPERAVLAEAVRLLPDLLRLLGRLARDRSVPRPARVRLWLALAYLAFPVDLVPDVVPVLGYADDAVVVAVVLRAVVRRTGLETVRRCWPGTPDGFAAVARLAGLERPGPAGRRAATGGLDDGAAR